MPLTDWVWLLHNYLYHLFLIFIIIFKILDRRPSPRPPDKRVAVVIVALLVRTILVAVFIAAALPRVCRNDNIARLEGDVAVELIELQRVKVVQCVLARATLEDASVSRRTSEISVISD